jgi:hypothetical protein
MCYLSIMHSYLCTCFVCYSRSPKESPCETLLLLNFELLLFRVHVNMNSSSCSIIESQEFFQYIFRVHVNMNFVWTQLHNIAISMNQNYLFISYHKDYVSNGTILDGVLLLLVRFVSTTPVLFSNKCTRLCITFDSLL